MSPERLGSIRFVHTADWQLGMRPYYLDERTQELFAEARFDAIRQIGRLAQQEACDCVVVAGDVFENQPDRRTVARALDAMATIPVPVYLLPGNHDPLEPGSVYRSTTFSGRKPDNVHVLDTPTLTEIKPGVEILAAPWLSRRPARDLVADVCESVGPAPGIRVLVGHGIVDSLSPSRDNLALIHVGPLENALHDRRLHYIALGDRHSVTRISDRIWYSGTPEATDFGEERPGLALIVQIEPDGACTVEEREAGHWHFVRREFELAGERDLGQVAEWLDQLTNKGRTIVRLGLTGTLPVRGKAALDQLLLNQEETFAAIERWDLKSNLAILPDDGDVDSLELAGFAREAWERLRAEAQPDEAQAELARDSLALLYRLAGGGT